MAGVERRSPIALAAESTAAGLRRGAFLVDVNSASPRTKIDCAGLVDAAGGATWSWR